LSKDRDNYSLNQYLSKLKQGQNNLTIELEYQHKEGNEINVEISASLISYHNQEMFCLVFRDITKRKKLEAKLKYRAYHDPLTGLSNRDLFKKYLSKALASAKRNNIFMAVMFLDLDHFKNINDNYGHDVGDELLKQFAQKLQGCLRYEDTIARWGGDEFTILLPQIDSKNDITRIVQRIGHCLQKPFQINQDKIQVNSSIGIAIYPQHGQEIEILLKKADIALYWAKEGGRNNFLFYSNNLNG
jgi:diguanylate cyclase (GGDEF)-like protein